MSARTRPASMTGSTSDVAGNIQFHLTAIGRILQTHIQLITQIRTTAGSATATAKTKDITEHIAKYITKIAECL